MLPFIFFIVILSYCHGFCMVEFGKLFILCGLWSFGSGICGRIWFYQDEKNGEGRRYGYRKNCIADGEQATGASRTGVGLGLSDLVMEACFTELLFPMRHKELCG